MRIGKGEDDGRGAECAVVGAADGLGGDVFDLAGAAVEARDLAAVHDIGIERIGDGVPVLFDTDGRPLAEGELSVVAAAGDAGRAALLLATANAIGEIVIGVDVIHLRGGLVVPGAPGFAAVDGDDGALIAHDEDDIGVVGVDPDALVIVAAGGAAESGPGFAGVGGFPGDGAGDVDGVGIFGIDGGNGEIAAADSSGGTQVGSGAHPMFTGVVGAVGAISGGGGEGGVEAAGIARGDGEVGLYEAIGAGGNAVGEGTPGGAAIGGFENAAAGSVPRTVFPGALPCFPERGVDDVGIAWIDLNVTGAGVFVFAEDLGE